MVKKTKETTEERLSKRLRKMSHEQFLAYMCKKYAKEIEKITGHPVPQK